MANRTTIRSVAKEAGVSITTVSNVINGRHQQMTADTLLRVQSAMDRLGYRPSHLARSLVTHRTATIGLIISELTNSLYPPVILGAEARCRAAGHSLLLANAEDFAAEKRAIETMRGKEVDGLILFSVSSVHLENEHLYRIQEEGTPVVVINRQLPPETPLSSVNFDHAGGARLATEHLISLGHRRIAHLAGPSDRFTGLQRRAGYVQALEAAGIAVDERLIAEGDYSFESGQELLGRVWRERPTAVFIGGDAMALGAFRAAADLGINVPEDLSLAAFGNPDFMRYATPAMTTVDLPVAEAGRAATDLVLRRIANPAETEVRTLETSLLIHETTASPGAGLMSGEGDEGSHFPAPTALIPTPTPTQG